MKNIYLELSWYEADEQGRGRKGERSLRHMLAPEERIKHDENYFVKVTEKLAHLIWLGIEKSPEDDSI